MLFAPKMQFAAERLLADAGAGRWRGPVCSRSFYGRARRPAAIRGTSRATATCPRGRWRSLSSLPGGGHLCPPGGPPATEPRGRLVVAATTGDTVGKQVGTELQNEEDRTHAHPFTATVELPYKPLASLNGTNRQGAAAGKYTSSGVSEPAPSGLPFIQLLACVKP